MNLDKPAYKTHEQEVDRLKRQAVLAKNEIKALTYSQKELTAVLASTPLVIMLMDREKRVKMVSDAVLQFTHRKAENILGLRGGEVLRCVHHIDDPEGCGSGPACDTCIVRNTVTDTLTTRNSHHKVAATLSLMDDSVQERHLLVSTVFIAVPDESVIIFVEDVTDQKKTETALVESEKKYRDLFENVSDFIYFHDLKGNFIETNLASKSESGYGKTELVDKNIQDFLVEKSKPFFDAYLDEVINIGTSTGLVRIETQDGKKRILEYRNSLVSGPNGPIGVRGCARDISERIFYEKTLKAEKEKLQKALEQIKTLSGLLPICASCKKIRDDKGCWNNLESYIENRSDAAFSHGMCPECSDKFYGSEDWYIKMKKDKGSL